MNIPTNEYLFDEDADKQFYCRYHLSNPVFLFVRGYDIKLN